jgi:hypothetical protein
MTESPEELAAVEQLLAEGDALRGWLARLDKAAVGSDVVRERVRNDYQKRLDQITAGLGAHADVVATKLAADRDEHAGLAARATEARDGLAEAELRHAVGEYELERFEGEQRRFSGDIETFDVALAAVAERIDRLEQVQALVQRGPRAIEAEPAQPSEPLADTSPAEPVEAPAEAAPIVIDELAPDEAEALAVFDEPLADESGYPDLPPPQPLPSAPETGPLSFRPSGEAARPTVAPPARARSFETAAPLGIPGADVPPRFVRPGERLGTAPPVPPPPMVEPPAAPGIVLRDDEEAPISLPDLTGGTAGRTLRCGECGAMNRPLEWYCEKCGAELTAV